ncbi:MAG TPA: CoA transferase [Acidimicrobiales bacterium]|jgi:crotonobetainyl-CoA:carnitine CoA-transferase CaiB-like acyl-CoA transferase|nr:CoA transferase [Acidimicrobiales bacterium]
MTSALLSGLRVLDLSIWRPGPYATSLLVALGADVLKVEPPGGDPMRHYPELFESINAGKRSVVLDLKDGDDRARALELAKEADALVEGFRPGVMARLGLDTATVRGANPAMVYCSISGYGQDDPRAALPGHDVNYQAWAGALSPEGGTAAMPRLPIADLAAGMSAAFGICAAVLGRHATGQGAHLDVSMTDVLATWTGRTGGGNDAGGGGSPAPQPVPGYGLFATADDGQVALGVLSEQHFWSSLCAELALDDVAGLPFEERSVRGAELQRRVAAAIAQRRRDELVDALSAVAVPVAPVLDRAGMLAGAPFPDFPIRLARPEVSHEVPTVDQHRGEGFPRKIGDGR